MHLYQKINEVDPVPRSYNHAVILKMSGCVFCLHCPHKHLFHLPVQVLFTAQDMHAKFFFYITHSGDIQYLKIGHDSEHRNPKPVKSRAYVLVYVFVLVLQDFVHYYSGQANTVLVEKRFVYHDLIDRISDATQAKRVVVKRIVQQFLDEVVAELAADNRLEFRDFGVFETRTRTARIAQNPKTLERVQVPAKRSVKFKMGRLLKEKMAKIPAVEEPQQTL